MLTFQTFISIMLLRKDTARGERVEFLILEIDFKKGNNPLVWYLHKSKRLQCRLLGCDSS